MAAAEGLDLSGLSGSGPGGRVIERDVAAALADRAPMTPAARAEAVKRGVETPSLGTGIGGRVTVEDVRRLAAGGGAAAASEAASGTAAAAASAAGAAGGAAPAAGDLQFPGPATDIAVRGVRKLTAERMLHSLQSTAQLTLNSSADARALQSYRKKLKNSGEERGLTGITLNDLVLYAVTRVLPRYPELNSHFLGDTIRRFEHVHLGFAVDTERGLMVPTIRFADRLTLKQLAAESRRLATACHEGSIESDELQGATFTVTNLGNLGIESFTPVLNPPQAGILGVSAITPQPTYQGEEVVHIPSLSLSLTIDHQAVDGAPGARFLKALAEAIGEFELLLAE
jgi:pyruvate dehydrogenase E2 component (dihydrolipoamide acetyltransferase)